MPFYRDVDNDYCQGDLIDGVPSIHLKQDQPLIALRESNLKGNRRVWEPLPPHGEPGGRDPDFKKGEVVPTFCQISRAILLSHGCEIDKDPKHRLVAFVRPLGPLPPADRLIIEEGRNIRFFHLPADESRGLEASYVDLRRITCVAPEFIKKSARLASLAEESAKGLMTHLIVYLTRRELIGPK